MDSFVNPLHDEMQLIPPNIIRSFDCPWLISPTESNDKEDMVQVIQKIHHVPVTPSPELEKDALKPSSPVTTARQFHYENFTEDLSANLDVPECPVLDVTSATFPIAIEFGEGCEGLNATELTIEIHALATAVRHIISSDDELSVLDRKCMMSQCMKEMVYHVNQGNVSVGIAAQTIHSLGAILDLKTSQDLLKSCSFIFDIPSSTSPSHLRVALSTYGHLKAVAVCYGPKSFGISVFCSCTSGLPVDGSNDEAGIYVKGNLVRLLSLFDVLRMRKFPISTFNRSCKSCFYLVSQEASALPEEKNTPNATPSRASTMSSPGLSLRLRNQIESDELLREIDVYCPVSEVRNEIELRVDDVGGLISYAIVNMHVGEPKSQQTHSFSSVLELEASILSKYMWLNNNDEIELDERKQCFYEVLVDVLSLTKSLLLTSNEAIKLLFESAAFFGLPLLDEVPVTLLIVTGICPKIRMSRWKRAFGKYGEIEEAVVTSDYNIGLVRYKSQASVRGALANFRVGRIDIKGHLLEFQAIIGNIQCILDTVNE